MGLVFVLLVRAFVCFCTCMFLFLCFSLPLGVEGLAAVCDCGIPSTFLLFFWNMHEYSSSVPG